MDTSMEKQSIVEAPVGKQQPAERPVGRLTAFMLFYLEHHDAVKNRLVKPNSRQHQPYRSADISREVYRLWRALDFQRVKDYCMLSNVYAESLARHGPVNFGRRKMNSSGGTNSTSNPGGNHGSNRRRICKSRRKKDPRLPKPPVSSFMCFSRHHRGILRSENREFGFSEIAKAIGLRWKAATVAERRPFDDLAAKDKTRYARELVEYKQWVRAEGSKGRKDEELATSAPAVAVAPVTSTAGATSVETQTTKSDDMPPAVMTAVDGTGLPTPTKAFQTLPQKRSATEIGVSWSTAASITPQSHHQDVSTSSHSTALSAPCTKKQRMENVLSNAGAPSEVAVDVPVSLESLPLMTSEGGEKKARVAPKAVATAPEPALDVGAVSGSDAFPAQQPELRQK